MSLLPVLPMVLLAAYTATTPAAPARPPVPAAADVVNAAPAVALAQDAGSSVAGADPVACTPASTQVHAAAVLVVGMPGVTRSQDPLARRLTDLGVGGVFVSESNISSAAQLTGLLEDLHERSERPLLVAADQESGRVASLADLLGAGPSPRELARTRTPDEVRHIAATLGTRLGRLGIDLDLAPVVDLDDGPVSGVIGDRSFSADPSVAAGYGLAFSAGLADAGVIPTVKHFPGHGRSATDTHRSSALVTTSIRALRTTDLLPFQQAIDAGAPVIMVNHLRYSALDPALPASLAPETYALLREMGFRGVVITDSLGMGAVNTTWDFPEAAVMAVAAGADAVLATDGTHAEAMREALVDAVADGTLPASRLAEAAARMAALAGGDPESMSCLDLHLPALSVITGPTGAAPAWGR